MNANHKNGIKVIIMLGFILFFIFYGLHLTKINNNKIKEFYNNINKTNLQPEVFTNSILPNFKNNSNPLNLLNNLVFYDNIKNVYLGLFKISNDTIYFHQSGFLFNNGKSLNITSDLNNITDFQSDYDAGIAFLFTGLMMIIFTILLFESSYNRLPRNNNGIDRTYLQTYNIDSSTKGNLIIILCTSSFMIAFSSYMIATTFI